mgnify:CR=1 FL=1
MKKRSLSHFVYYAANRAFPVFLLLLLLLGFTACSAEKGAKALDYPAMFGETKNEVLAALDAENLTYKEDDLYANAYVLDRTETLENRDFSVYLLFDLNTDTLYGYRRVLVVENPTDADCKLPEKLGVCLDTCHVHDAGYDIVSHFEDVLAEFDRVLGLSRLRAIHLNDSKNPLGARKDRHECIGRGELGLEALERVLRFAAARDLPVVLETPNDLTGYAAEIALLRNNF